MSKINKKGVYQLPNGFWGFRISININGKKIDIKKTKDEFGQILKTENSAIKIQTVNSMKYHTRVIKQTLGISFKYHYLRHTYGTRLAELNTPTHILCNQMGHGSGKVTEKYYLAVFKNGIEILKDKIDNL